MGGVLPSTAEKEPSMFICGTSMMMEREERMEEMKEREEMLPSPLLDHYNRKKKSMIQNLEERAFEITDDPVAKLENDENYGIVPLNVLHNVMLFLKPSELLSMSLTCRLFYNIQNTSLFWKSYYHEFFKMDDIPLTPEEIPIEKTNWKKQFFKRFFGHSDYFYRKKYKILDMLERKLSVDEPKAYWFKIVILGVSGVGKSTFMHLVKKNEFLEDIDPTQGASFKTLTAEYVSKRDENKKGYLRGEFWDTSGNIIYRNLLPMYFRKSDHIVVFFGLNDLNSFKEAKEFVKYVFRDENNKKGLGFTLVGNKLDLEREVVYKKHVEPFLKENDHHIINYVECSLKKKINVYKVLGLIFDEACNLEKSERKREMY